MISSEMKLAFLCRTEMYNYFFGTHDILFLESQLANF